MEGETKSRQYWTYAEISNDERSVLRRMAKAEDKTVAELTQAIMYPALRAEIDAFVAKEAEAAAKATESAPAETETGEPVGPKG